MNYTILEYGNTICPQTWHSDGNTKNYHKIYYCLEGSAQYKDNHSTAVLKPGFLYIFPQHMPYQITHTEELFFHVLWFHADTILPTVHSFYKKEIPEDSLSGALLSSLSLSMAEKPKLLSTLLPAFMSSLDIPECCVNSHSRAVTDCIAYIHHHLSKPISNDILADISGYNKRYFIQLFQQQTGQTPRQYIIHAKFNLAKKYLAAGKTITECSQKVGYENASAFSRDFKSLFSITPSAYQKQTGIP